MTKQTNLKGVLLKIYPDTEGQKFHDFSYTKDI